MVIATSGHAEKILHATQTSHLDANERDVLARFLARLESECGDEIRRVILFGSKARGDADEESDVDVAIVTTENTREKVKKIADEYRDATNLLLNAWIFDDSEYQAQQEILPPLYVNLRRDGIELWDDAARLVEEMQVPLNFPEGELRRMDEQTKQVVRHYIEQAKHSRIAVEALRSAAPDIAVSRAYYSAFYWLTAALYVVNVVRSKHHEVSSALSQFLIKPNLIEEEFKDIYLRLMNNREVVDYYAAIVTQKKKPVRMPTNEECEQLLAEAEKFIARMEQFLRERGAIE